MWRHREPAKVSAPRGCSPAKPGHVDGGWFRARASECLRGAPRPDRRGFGRSLQHTTAQRPDQRTDLFLEDLSAGQIFGSATYQIGVAEIKQFAGAFDPQPFHLDEEEAARSLFGGLAASGWHTAAITMRLLVGSVRISGGIVGTGMDALRWPRPVRPGDTLRIECEVLEVRPSKSHPDRALAKVRTTTLNQHGESVQVLVANLVVPRRPSGETGA